MQTVSVLFIPAKSGLADTKLSEMHVWYSEDIKECATAMPSAHSCSDKNTPSLPPFPPPQLKFSQNLHTNRWFIKYGFLIKLEEKK